MPSSALATIPPTSLDERLTYAQHFAQAGMFADVKGISQCFLKIQAGAELGFPPFVSMTGIHIIEGKPTLSAQMLGALIDAAPDCEIEVLEQSQEAARGRFWTKSKRSGKWEVKGEFAFTWQDAIKAGISGKQNWQRYRQQMLYWRMVASGARMYFPARCAGLYIPDELNAPVDEEGNYVAPAREPARARRTVEPAAVETVAAAADPEPIDPERELRADLESRIVEEARVRKFKATPKTIADALLLEVPYVVREIFQGKGGFKLERLTTGEAACLLYYLQNGVPATDQQATDLLIQVRQEREAALASEPDPESAEGSVSTEPSADPANTPEGD